VYPRFGQEKSFTLDQIFVILLSSGFYQFKVVSALGPYRKIRTVSGGSAGMQV